MVTWKDKVILWIPTEELRVMSVSSKHNQRCQMKIFQNQVIRINRKLLYHIPLMLQVFQVQLIMLCHLARLVHVFYCSQFESRSMMSGGVVDVTFFYTKSNRSYAIWCIRWVRNGLMHSRCLMLLLWLVCLVSVHYAKFAMLYCKVQKVLATRCIARTFPWYVRHFIVLTCLPT